MTDVINEMAGIAPGSHLDELRDQRGEAKAQAQATFDALFSPVDDTAFPMRERLAVAAFVAGLTQVAAGRDFYAARLSGADAGLGAAIEQAVSQAVGSGPYGTYGGDLAAEDQPGTDLSLANDLSQTLGPRVTTALQHAHLLVLHPRDSGRERLVVLEAAGWDADGIVSLSQLISFLSFQLRVVAGLQALQEAK